MTPRVVVIAAGSCGDVRDRIAAIVSAVPRGTVAIQVRDKALDGGPLLRLVRDVLAVARPAGVPVWVNDRVDVAQIAGADGVHLPEAGLPIRIARELMRSGPGRSQAALTLGASRHSADGALSAAAEGADVVQLGPIFATPEKAPIGAEVLHVRTLLPLNTRLVAVGGIQSPQHAHAAVAAGADAVAVIRAWTGDDPANAVAALVAAVDTALELRGRHSG